MGCCGSSEAEATESEIPAPQWGAPLKVNLKKQGMFSADYDVLTLDDPPAKWMYACGDRTKGRARGCVDARTLCH